MQILFANVFTSSAGLSVCLSTASLSEQSFTFRVEQKIEPLSFSFLGGKKGCKPRVNVMLPQSFWMIAVGVCRTGENTDLKTALTWNLKKQKLLHSCRLPHFSEER